MPSRNAAPAWNAGVARASAATRNRRSAEEGEMTPQQYEFIRAIEMYKRVNKKPFSDVDGRCSK